MSKVRSSRHASRAWLLMLIAAMGLRRAAARRNKPGDSAHRDARQPTLSASATFDPWPKRRVRVQFVVALVALVGWILAMPAGATASQRDSLKDLADRLVRCFDLDGEQYCLHVGFADLQPGTQEWDRTWQALEGVPATEDGDASLGDELRYLATLPQEELTRIEDAELEAARGAVGKVKLFDHVGYGIPIPPGFFDRYPELGIAEDSAEAVSLRSAAATRTLRGSPDSLSAASNGGLVLPMGVDPYPTSRYLIASAYRQQIRADYCGPATMQSVDGGDDGSFETQDYWAPKVGSTGSSGYAAAISKIVATINSDTNWDLKAGTYAVVNTKAKGASWYFDVHALQIGVQSAVVVDHVRLERQFFSYLNQDHGGHFQTGRGYSTANMSISIFEPLDERDFFSGGNYTGKIQTVDYIDAYNANQHYLAHNMNPNIGA